MAETQNSSEEKLVSGLPPKLDLRKDSALKVGAAPAPQPTQATTMMPKPPASPQAGPGPAAPKPAGIQTAKPAEARPPGPAIKLGFSAEPEAKKPAATVIAPQGAPKPFGGEALKKPILAAPGAPKPVAPAPTVVAGPPRPTTAPQAAPIVGEKPLAKKETSKIPLGAATTISGTVGAAKLAGAAPVAVAQPAAGEAKIPAKKETSKISLEMATPKPTMGAPQLSRPGQPAKPLNMATAQIQAEKLVDEKRMTTRISLDAVMMTDAEVGKPASALAAAADAGAPKTIRLKRPGESSTVKVAQKPKMSKAEDGGGAVPTASLSRTARLEDAPEEEGEADSPTKRKTIKIKRPAQAAVEAGAGGGAAEVAMAAAPAMAPVPIEMEDEPMILFPIFGIVAALVVAATIYMFLAQVIGPSDLSYWSGGPDLGWPGKIMGR